jgi:hypothetical protein
MAYGHRKRSTLEPVPITTFSYVTYANLTPSLPAPLPLSQVLDDDYAFQSDLDLNPFALLAKGDIVFPQPLQD